MVWITALAGHAASESHSHCRGVAPDIAVRRSDFHLLHGRIVSSRIADLAIHKCSGGNGRSTGHASGAVVDFSASTDLDSFRLDDQCGSYGLTENDRPRVANSRRDVSCAVSAELDLGAIRSA